MQGTERIMACYGHARRFVFLNRFLWNMQLSQLQQTPGQIIHLLEK